VSTWLGKANGARVEFDGWPTWKTATNKAPQGVKMGGRPSGFRDRGFYVTYRPVYVTYRPELPLTRGACAPNLGGEENYHVWARFYVAVSRNRAFTAPKSKSPIQRCWSRVYMDSRTFCIFRRRSRLTVGCRGHKAKE
jgi:hypothetical protein